MQDDQFRWFGRPPEVLTLVAFDLLGAAVSLLGVFEPVVEDAPQGLYAWAALTGLAFAATLWTVGRQAPRMALHANLLVLLVATTVLVANAATGEGAASIGITFVAVAMWVAMFLDRPVARGYVGAALLAHLAALHLNDGVRFANRTWFPVAVALVATSEALAMLHGRVRRLTLTDPLTGALNRTGFLAAVERERNAARRTAAPIALVVIDLDGFKAVNDRHGHAAGDALLAELVAEWRAGLRPGDAVARRGGDEFTLLLPGIDDAEATAVVRRLRATSSAMWSWGVAALRSDDDLDDALHRADEAMYAQKAAHEAPPSVAT